jgi:hypothetical protein
MEMDDIVGWHFDSKGIFSVRSAYKVHRALEERQMLKHSLGGAEGSSGKGDF